MGTFLELEHEDSRYLRGFDTALADFAQQTNGIDLTVNTSDGFKVQLELR